MKPVLAIAAWSGTGKTSLLKKLIPALYARGIRTGVIKHTHHNMDIDKPGKDSYELRHAGAAQTMVASTQRWALMTETPEKDTLDLNYLVDLVLVEGFKHESVAKILLFRQGTGHGVDELTLDQDVIAVASDVSLTIQMPVLNLNNTDEIADFIEAWLQRQ